MAVYARALFPRVLVVTAVWIIASGTITFAADRTLVPRARVKTTPAAPKPILIVPDVRSQTFVFAKGILEDGGFAWHVAGAVHGFATNRVVSQTPTPGTRVFDTGAPTIRLSLARGQYGQDGTPENMAPYPGTSIVLADAVKTSAATCSCTNNDGNERRSTLLSFRMPTFGMRTSTAHARLRCQPAPSRFKCPRGLNTFLLRRL